MNTVEQDTRSERDRHCDGLQALVDLLRAHPDLPTCLPSGQIPFVVGIYEDQDPKLTYSQWARTTSHLKPQKVLNDRFYNLDIDFGGLSVELIAYREQVCERIVTGTETVTKTVKDPDALAAVPKVEVVEEVETVEWRCIPLLAEDVSA